MATSLRQDDIAQSAAESLALIWLDMDVCARAFVDEDMRILWANKAAAAMFARRRDVENREGRLTTVNRARQDQFSSFVLACGPSIESWCMNRDDGDGHLLFRAQRVEFRGQQVFAMSFFGSGTDFKARYANLDKAFGLTRSEHRVLLDLLDGKEARAISESQATSIETVRTHVRHIYMKVGVSSRETLYYRLRPYRA